MIARSGHLLLGEAGESAAAAFMESQGYTLLDRNWRMGHLELDLVFSKDDGIVFAEVKTRSRNIMGGPAAAITSKKIKNLIYAAQAWLLKHELWDSPCRFDVICVLGRCEPFKVEHFKNAFEVGQIMDCCRAYWQY